MAVNNQHGSNRAFNAMMVDLNAMDQVIVRANTVSARNWIEHRLGEVNDGINDAIDCLREYFEESTFLHRARGGNPNNNDEFSDIHLSITINVDDGTGRHHGNKYSLHPDSVNPQKFSTVAGVVTVDPEGTLERANRVRDAVLKRDNLHKFTAMRNVAQQRLNTLAGSIEFKDAENVVEPTEAEVNDAISVIRRSVKRRRMSPEDIIQRAYYDPESIHNEDDDDN